MLKTNFVLRQEKSGLYFVAETVNLLPSGVRKPVGWFSSNKAEAWISERGVLDQDAVRYCKKYKCRIYPVQIEY